MYLADRCSEAPCQVILPARTAGSHAAIQVWLSALEARPSAPVLGFDADECLRKVVEGRHYVDDTKECHQQVLVAAHVARQR